ncbi:hypothetical protein SASPL_106467 [Salvia splendens]|uniref:Fibronectin type III-like domain-containing protein n=1 Tax=Salvia splendens TaxID=180675 RepID=A0A8X8YSJ2_SALSN|nr:probable beta-D-xylosidase 7 [Salvia splendens]KAG6434823.1 hypothetical protein SASPL_106467 [Salvia splendens]
MPVRERARDLISRLTLDEKISQLSNNASAIPRLGVPYYQWWSEALHGLAAFEGVETGISFDGVVKAATSFPQIILTASSFDAHLWYRIAKVIGTEGRAMYNEGQATGLTFWAPNINIFRDPRWGRGQETPGEDPLLTAKYATSFVRGLQGDSFEGGALKDGHLQASACCKHFTAYDLESWKGYERFTFNAQVTKRDLADTYQPSFKGCVEEGKASGLMCAYNLVNGVPNCVDYDLLTKTARGEWGFDGYITSDCDAVSLLFRKQHYAKSDEEAVADALKAGMDVGCGPYLGNYAKSAVLKGIISESDIDKALENLFTVRMRLGLFNGPPSGTYGKLGRADVCAPEHQELALEAARQGIVLLKNERKLLPLSKAKKGTLAVIGPNAKIYNTLLGNYAGPPCSTISPLQGLMSYVEDVKFEQGCGIVNGSSVDEKRAVELAKSADHVVLVMGSNQLQEAEYIDRVDLVLPGKQQSLIMSVAEAAKKPVVLVLLCGGPIDVSFAKNEPKIGSILWAGYPGQAGGRAIAEIIFGDYNPGGRLTMTWYPQDFVKIPMIDMRMRADPSSGFPGRTYRFYKGEKVFEFGYGLSYTTYSYKIDFVGFDMKASSSTSNLGYISIQELGSGWCEKARFLVRVSVKNKGKMAGKHPVLLFLKRTQYSGGIGSPMKQLIGFQPVRINAKEKASVEFSVSPCEHFSSANEDGEMVIELGDASLVVGDEEHPFRINL